MGVVIQAIRDSAKGEQCMLRTSRCNHDNATTVFCHGPRLDLAGISQKSDDWWGAYGCSECHRWLDEHRVGADWEEYYWFRGIARTQRRLYEKGIMQFPETPKPPRVVTKIVKHPGVIR